MKKIKAEILPPRINLKITCGYEWTICMVSPWTGCCTDPALGSALDQLCRVGSS